MAYSDIVTVLDETEVVAIVTTRKSGERAATPIWSMVVDGVPYVRSAYGSGAWWYKHVMAGRPVSFAMGDGAVAETDRDAALDLEREEAVLVPIAADAPIQDAVSAEVESKYAGALRSSIDAMLSPAAIACTFRVDAA